ncbi:MAG: hypothetical protein J7K04_08935, partial [Spirochaetales bacterium]|nr:hypothetical protein [Spirochaetales bacterium]
MRYEYREENPDWMAQVAHSLREIIYPFHSSKKRGMAFKNYGSTYDIEKSIQDSGRYYNFITNIAHHNFIKAGQNSLIGGSKDNAVKVTPEVFEIVVRQFAKILFAILRRQIDAHKEIDRIFEARPNNTIIANAKSLKDLNPDAHQYFFAKADENWLSWLWENGFLDAIKQKAKEPARYTYNIPELYYLVRMAEKKPEQVADIMLKVSISKETLNSEVIDQFLHICIELPPKQLARIVPKIQQENWVKLIAAFNEWGFEYKKMFQTLADTKDYKGILMLAEAVLSVRTGEESIQTSRGFLSDNPFYLKDLLYTEVFNYLTSVDDEHAEQALELTVKIMTKVILLSGKAKSGEVFPVQDFYYLSDIDFFSLSLSEKEHLSYRDNVRELTATIKILTQRLIGERCSKESYIRFIHEKYIKTLPENKSMWRLRLFVLSLCPKVFKDELRRAFSRLFKVMDAGKSYFYIDSGTEYKKALKKSFAVLGREYQREYIEKVFKYFGGNFKDKEEEKLHKQNGWQILSSICRYLTVKEKEKCEEIFGNKCDSAFEPVPSIGPTEGGWISDRGPISKERFNKLKISAIAEKLRTEWRPENLQKKNTYNDFLNPINAEGVGEQLKDDINKRLQDYVKNANLFFKRDVIDQHYTYSFFRGIHEAVHSNRTNAESLNWNGLIELCLNIKKEGEREPFNREMRERHEFDTWLSGWEDVHSAMAQTIKELIREVEGRIVIDFLKYRDKIFKIISYLLDYPHPIPEDEEPETAIMKSQSPGDNTYIVSDLFSIAINTVRGQAFEALVFFVYRDGKGFAKEEKIKIHSDVKKLYETVLEKEKTRALMFMFGYYLPAFYFRDKEWIHRLLPEIFPEKLEKKHLYLASWEGYLVNKLYEEIFFDPYFQKLYKRGLAFTGKEDPKRKFFKDPDESIAAHFALAFVVFHNRFGFDHPL